MTMKIKRNKQIKINALEMFFFCTGCYSKINSKYYLDAGYISHLRLSCILRARKNHKEYLDAMSELDK